VRHCSLPCSSSLAAGVSALLAAILCALVLASTPAAGAPGELDRSFGQGGHARVQANTSCARRCVEFGGSYAKALALLPDGAIILAGSENHGFGITQRARSDQGALARLLADGAPDTSFGPAGIEGTPFAVEQIDATPGGGLIAMGRSEAAKIAVSRYTPAGVLDGSFGQQGVRLMPRPTGSVAVHRDSRGRVLALAAFNLNSVDLVRYLPTGALDRGFGHGGYVGVFVPNASGHPVRPSETPPQAAPIAMAIQPDGGVFVAFEVAPFHSSDSSYWPSVYFLEHFMPNGRLDRAFGKRGLLALTGEATAMAVAPDGHLFAAWADPPVRLHTQRRSIQLPAAPRRLALTQYTPTGRLDPAFGRRGVALSRLLSEGRRGSLEPTAIAFDRDREPIVVGEGANRTTDTPSGTVFLARYTKANLDCSFGEHGVVFDPELDGAGAVAVQPNERIVVAGWSGNAFAAARYLGGGPRRTCPG
jgi:uncharacterized delta-60 repeat protein